MDDSEDHLDSVLRDAESDWYTVPALLRPTETPPYTGAYSAASGRAVGGSHESQSASMGGRSYSAPYIAGAHSA